MQIKISLQIFIFVIIFYLTRQINVYAILMLLAFIHECGHLLAGLLLKLKPKKLEINPFGLAIIFEEFGCRNKEFELKKMLIAIAGPATNLIIILIVILFNLPIDNLTKEILIYANILIIAFNMLPIFPLDGGRIVRSALYIMKGRKISEDVTNKIANIGAIILTFAGSIAIYYFKNIAILFMLMYLWALVIKENKRYFLKEKVERIIKQNP
ncbi:MAG: site-2 protease family protein [Clostridia bacterium]|nr:site-2 protease family protein [Clostridia bacterium]